MKIRSCLDKELKCRISDGIKVMKAFRIGALEVIRTPDIRLRRPTLYPAEVRAQLVTDNFSRVITIRIKKLYEFVIFYLKLHGFFI